MFILKFVSVNLNRLILLPPEFTEIEDRIRSITRQNYQELDDDREIFNMLEQLSELNINVQMRRRMIYRLDHLRRTRFHYFQYLNYIDNQLNSIQKLNGVYKEILKEEVITEITKQDANFIFDLAKRLALPEEYKLLEKIINRVKLENRLLLEADTVIFDAVENSKLTYNDKQQLQYLRIKRFTLFSYQVAISLIVDVENGFVLRRQILADQYLNKSLRKKLMDQFNEKIIPICLNIEPDQPQLYPQEYLQINNFIDTITFENYQNLLVDGSIDYIIQNSQLSVELKLQLHSKQNMMYFYFDYVRQINEADHEQDLLELRNELSNDKILPSDLKNNLIQMIDKRIADDDTCKYCKRNDFKCIRIQPRNYESELTRLITEVDDLKVRVLRLEKDNRIIKRNLLQCKLLDEELNDII
ncbi:hypothetical protein C2G38_2187120 [Gigaspora rosea]|uniref:Uncharacterized protein n=1 Tax=Gigaspora rosea TaxID=44941 RepID=A0A397V9A3_9GLOM|nr:hypothetical protein C2G38_2187120 [Gigaspora rosea]